MSSRSLLQVRMLSWVIQLSKILSGTQDWLIDHAKLRLWRYFIWRSQYTNTYMLVRRTQRSHDSEVKLDMGKQAFLGSNSTRVCSPSGTVPLPFFCCFIHNHCGLLSTSRAKLCSHCGLLGQGTKYNRCIGAWGLSVGTSGWETKSSVHWLLDQGEKGKSGDGLYNLTPLFLHCPSGSLTLQLLLFL